MDKARFTVEAIETDDHFKCIRVNYESGEYTDYTDVPCSRAECVLGWFVLACGVGCAVLGHFVSWGLYLVGASLVCFAQNAPLLGNLNLDKRINRAKRGLLRKHKASQKHLRKYLERKERYKDFGVLIKARHSGEVEVDWDKKTVHGGF